MNANDYQKLAGRTLLDKPDARYSDHEIMLVWNAIGLTDEVAELVEALQGRHGAYPSIIKEIGDVWWYTAALCTTLGISLQNIAPTNYEELYTGPEDLVISAGKVAGHVKKGVFHRHGVDRNVMMDLLEHVIGALLTIHLATDVSVEMAFEANVEKLRQRYPEGYSSERSINR